MSRQQQNLERAHYRIHYIAKSLRRTIDPSSASQDELAAITHARDIKGNVERAIVNRASSYRINRLIASVHVGDLVSELDSALRLTVEIERLRNSGRRLRLIVYYELLAEGLQRAAKYATDINRRLDTNTDRRADPSAPPLLEIIARQRASRSRISASRRNRIMAVRIIFTAVVGLVLIIAPSALLLWQYVTRAPNDTNLLAAVLAAILAAIAVAGTLTTWGIRRYRMARRSATPEQIRQAAARLKEDVWEQWSAEAQARALDDPEPMPVRWRLAMPDLMDSPAAINRPGPLIYSGGSNEIDALVEAFMTLTKRRLVIIGGPGTGKTTLAVQLLRVLLSPQHPDLINEVPVMFALSTWDLDRYGCLEDWLAEQLDQTYPALRAISVDAAAALAYKGRLITILDGLDEVPSHLQPLIVEALNQSPDAPIILTSRKVEFRDAVAEADETLSSAATIVPYTLRPIDATRYLRKRIPPTNRSIWSELLASLEQLTAAPTDELLKPICEIISTPLGLWVVCVVYVDGRTDPKPLIDGTFPTVAALRAHLLDELIPSLVASRPPLPRRRDDSPDKLRPRRAHRASDLHRWLTVLSLLMSASESRDWQWWLASPRWMMRLFIRSAIVLAGTALVWLISTLGDWPDHVNSEFRGFSEVFIQHARGVSQQYNLKTQESITAWWQEVVRQLGPDAASRALRQAGYDSIEALRAAAFAQAENPIEVGIRDSMAHAASLSSATPLILSALFLAAWTFSSVLKDVQPGRLQYRFFGRAWEFVFRILGGLSRGVVLLALMASVPILLFFFGFFSAKPEDLGGIALALMDAKWVDPGGSLHLPTPIAVQYSAIAIVVVIGLTVGSINFFRSSSDVAARSASPWQTYRDDRRLTIVRVCAFGLAGSLVSAIALNLAFPGFGLAFGSLYGLAVGSITGLTRSAYFKFGCAMLTLKLRGWRLVPAPWQAMATFEDCYRLGLLRAVGPSYQFRHAELQDHLSRQPP